MGKEYTVSELAEILDLSVDRIQRWIEDGRLVLDDGEWYLMYKHMPRRKVSDVEEKRMADREMLDQAKLKTSEEIVHGALQELIDEHGLDYLESLIDKLPIDQDEAWIRVTYLSLRRQKD